MLSLNPDAMAQNRSGNLQLSGTPINETSPEPAASSENVNKALTPIGPGGNLQLSGTPINETSPELAS